ncbi:MAG: hypothetical protein AVDCRST_MAG93-7874, partial [uncultured Chloroflexia bacterium]
VQGSQGEVRNTIRSRTLLERAHARRGLAASIRPPLRL